MTSTRRTGLKAYTRQPGSRAITAGSFVLFFLLFLLFARNFPAISMAEMKESADVPEEADPATSWPAPV